MIKEVQLFIMMLFMLAIALYFIATVNASESAIKRLNPTLSNAYIAELNNAFLKASAEYNIDVDLLIAMGFLESSFRSDLKGDGDKSWGIMQVGKQGRKRCGYVDTVEGQIMSGSCWLNEGVKWCGSLKGGVTAYACGHCTPTGYRCKQAVKRRFKLMEGLKK